MGYIDKEDLTFITTLDDKDTHVHSGATLDASEFHYRSSVQTEFKMKPDNKHDDSFYDIIDTSCRVTWELRIELREWGVKYLQPEVVDVEINFDVVDFMEEHPPTTITIDTETEKAWEINTSWVSDNKTLHSSILIQPTEVEVDIEKKKIEITF